MKRTFWKTWNTALVCGLALSLSSVGWLDLGFAAQSKGGGKGGGKSAASKGGGSAPRSSGGAPRSSVSTPRTSVSTPRSSGSAPRFSGSAPRSASGGAKGGIHAPPIAAPRQSAPSQSAPRQPAPRVGQPPSSNRAPSSSRPNTGQPPAATAAPPVTARPPTGARIGTSPSVKTHGNAPSGVVRRGDQGSRGNVGAGAATQRPGISHSRIASQPFVGNTVNFNNRNFNVGHNSYRPAYYRHPGYNGYWNVNRSYGSGSAYRPGLRPGVSVNLGAFGLNIGSSRGYGGYGHYGYRPLGWGLGGWGLGSMYYHSGYLRYSNPYYINSYGSYGNYAYSQPIPVPYNSSLLSGANDPNSSDEVLNNAVAAFQQNDYDAALDIINKGVARYPDDAVLHEFRSLVLFARQDYQQSAATIHSVLAVGPGWDWTTLSGMYSNVAIYTEQLRALEAFTKANPQDAASRFLLAYHYMSCGYPDAAARHLQQVVKLMPNDRVAADMLKLVAAPQPSQPGETVQPPTPQPPQEPTRPAAPPVNPATLVGTWKAARPDGSKFDLTLTNDAKFTWSFTPKGQAAQTFGGTYTVEGNVLALERQDGGSLIAEVTPGGEAKFNFKLVGAPDDDPGLAFSR